MRNLVFFSLLLASLFTFCLKADESPKPVKTEKLILIEKEPERAPRTLGDLFVTCYYNNECLEVEFPADVDSMDITISDGAVTIWSGFVTADAPACDIPYLVGQYQITCTTDNGAVYQGILSL